MEWMATLSEGLCAHALGVSPVTARLQGHKHGHARPSDIHTTTTTGQASTYRHAQLPHDVVEELGHGPIARHPKALGHRFIAGQVGNVDRDGHKVVGHRPLVRLCVRQPSLHASEGNPGGTQGCERKQNTKTKKTKKRSMAEAPASGSGFAPVFRCHVRKATSQIKPRCCALNKQWVGGSDERDERNRTVG